jgi:hypothetical protein
MIYLGTEFSEETLGTVLEDKINILGIIKEPIEFEYIGMVHIGLQFDFPKHLSFHVCFFYFEFVHDFYRKYTMS